MYIYIYIYMTISGLGGCPIDSGLGFGVELGLAFWVWRIKPKLAPGP